MMISPKNSAVASTPSTSTKGVHHWPWPWRSSSAWSAMEPPSPWLSARMTMVTYFSVTTSIMVQKITDSTP